jgi:hypothetical protein
MQPIVENVSSLEFLRIILEMPCALARSEWHSAHVCVRACVCLFVRVCVVVHVVHEHERTMTCVVL